MNRRLMACFMAACILSSSLYPMNFALADSGESEVQTASSEETKKPEPKPEEKPKAEEKAKEEDKSKSEDKPREAEKPKDEDKPTPKPTEKPTEKPIEKPTEKPADTPAPRPEEKPAETDKPVEKPSEKPEDKPSESPVTKAPEQTASAPAQTDAPETAKEPEQKPDATASAGPTASQKPESTPAAEKTDSPVQPSDPTQVPETQQPSEAPSASPEATSAPGASESPAVTVDPETTEEPETTDAPEATEEPEANLLSVRISGVPAYVLSGDEIALKVKVSGGAVPYSVSIRVLRDGDRVEKDSKSLEEPDTFKYKFTPKKYGEHTFEVTVTDAEGSTAETDAFVPVASHKTEDRDEWEETMEDVVLTGDWRTDILAIARTQLGYEESTRNFVVHDDGHLQGYTRYGDWYGKTYYEWCGMFVAFCASYAGIPEEDFPRDNISAHWREALIKRDAYEEDSLTYIPQPGDLIYFNWENRDSKRLSDEPEHIGIVEKVKDDTVHTIEGNSGKKVRRREYKLDDPAIIGYCNTAKLMQAAGVPTETEILLPAEEEITLPEEAEAPVPEEAEAPVPEAAAEPIPEVTAEPVPEAMEESLPESGNAEALPADIPVQDEKKAESSESEAKTGKKTSKSSSRSSSKSKKADPEPAKLDARPAEPALIPDKGMPVPLPTEAPLLADKGFI